MRGQARLGSARLINCTCSGLMRNKLRHIPSVISSSAAKIDGKIMARAPATRTRHRLSGPAAGPVAGHPPAGGAARRLRAARGRPLPFLVLSCPARPRSAPSHRRSRLAAPRGEASGAGRRATAPPPRRGKLPAPPVPGAPEGRRIGPAVPGSCPSPPAPLRSWRWSAALFLLLLALK